MSSPKRDPKSVDSYIAAFPAPVQSVLKRIRRSIKKAAPGAVESISYQMPAYALDGKFLVSFAAWKEHIGLYPIPAGNPDFRKRVQHFRAAKSTLRLPLAQPIPIDLVEELVRFRIRESRKQK